MQLETFRGNELQQVIKQVRRTLGNDAMIVRTRVIKNRGSNVVEVIAARPQAIESFRSRLDGGRAAAIRARGRRRVGPYVVALVGPAGAGKTTTCMKVALHPAGVGHRKVGLITLDTFRVGALEAIQTYAEIADLPLESVYHRSEVDGALQRLRDRDVIIVDPPGRGFGNDSSAWIEILRDLDPDEVHLVMPAGLRAEVARGLTEAVPGLNPTHVLFSKLDEAGAHTGLAELAEAVALPARWVTEGPEIPAGLDDAGRRILASLGIEGSEDLLGVQRRAG